MGRKHESVTLSMTPNQKQRLEKICLGVGAMWGEKPNISELMRLIADGAISLHRHSSPIRESDRDFFNTQIMELESVLNNLKKL